jgi:stress-induced morphogen
MVYTLLAGEMNTPGGIHALSIYAKTPTEEANK